METGVREAGGSFLFRLEGDFGICVSGWETGVEGDSMVSSAGLEDLVARLVVRLAVRFGSMCSG